MVVTALLILLFPITSMILVSAPSPYDFDEGRTLISLSLVATFRDAAGSALIAYSTYRLASLSPNDTRHIAAAEAIYSAVQDKITPMGIFAESLDVPDALTFTSPAQMSPESLAFLVLMSSARRDYNQGNVTGSAGIGSGASASSTATSAAASSITAQLHGWTAIMLICSLSSALIALTIL